MMIESRMMLFSFLEPLSETGTVSSTAANDDSVVTLHLHRTHHKAPIPAVEECNLSTMNLEDKVKKMEKANQQAKGIIHIIPYKFVSSYSNNL